MGLDGSRAALRIWVFAVRHLWCGAGFSLNSHSIDITPMSKMEIIIIEQNNIY